MRVFFCLLMLLSPALFGADAERDWAAVLELDRGPGVTPKSAEEARTVAAQHLDRQEKALRAFLADHPADARGLQARLRLARLLEIRADLHEKPAPAEVAEILEEAAARVRTPKDRADFDFAQLSRQLRQWQGKRLGSPERREALRGVRTFQKAHPKDSRVAALLLEVATLYEGEIATKEPLLLEARKLTDDPGLKAQIADDLRRIAHVGRVLPLRFTDLQGRKRNISEWRGKPVVLLFFATPSEPARQAFSELQSALEPFGDSVALVGVSLDTEKADVVKFLQERKAGIPVAWEGKGWDGPIIQALGINAVPSAWILDQRGAVRTLDALENPAGLLRQLL